jgi:uncharacterized tellurite resistance protein B-like protein
MEHEFTDKEAFLALCLAVAGMKKAGFIDCEYELKEILNSSIKKMPTIFNDGGAFSFDEKNLEIFIKKIKDSLSEDKTEILFETAVEIAVADGVLKIEAELIFLKKIHSLLSIKKDFNLIIEEKTGI